MLTTGTRLGPYEVVGSLGAGGMGEVYRARDTRLNRDVAIKILPELFASDPDRVARFSREAQALASLNHPHIAQIYGIEDSSPTGAGESTRAIVMELVEGETLADRIGRGPLPLDEAVPIARQIAEALEAAHECGIVHRDLKPANVKLRADGTVKVLDFGLAKPLGPRSLGSSSPPRATPPTVTSPAMTVMGMVMGTAAYMSPEQAKGRAVDKRADMWAFGCVLYEMLTGRRAFDGDDVSDVFANVLKAEPDWRQLSPDLPPSIHLLLRGCLEKDPQKRVGDAAVARFVLGGVTAGAPARAPRTPIRWLALAAAIAATAVLTYAATRLIAPSATVLPLRLSVVPDPAAPLGMPSSRDIAISPDGRAIVYRTDVGGVSRLVMRRLDELEGAVMQGTDNAFSPFFSPDGRWVGFFAERTVNKVAIAGGTPITLCAVTTAPRGGAWHGDEVYFATIDTNDGIFSVSAAGGEPKLLTKPDLASGEGDHLFPFVLPNGLVLFTIEGTAASNTAEPPHQVAVFDPRTSERRALVYGTQPQYVEPGILLFVSGGTLRAARFDPSAGRLTSEPVAVVERIWVNPNGSANYAVSDTGTLVYVRGNPTTAIVQRSLVWVNRDGRETPVPGDPRPFADPRLSPDGQRIVVEVADVADDIWVLDANRGASTRLTLERGQDETPIWMPDGRSVVYASTRAGVARAIHRRRVDGVGGEELLWTGSDHAHVDAVTHDGKALILTVSPAAGPRALPDLTLLPLDGSATLKPLLKTPFAEYGARLSPDGRWLAYTANDTGRDEVFVRAFPSLDGKVAVSTNGGSAPVWSSGGDELFFIGPRGQGLFAARVKSGTEFSVSAIEQLFDATYFSKGFAHTPYDVDRDGRFLAVKDSRPAESDSEPRVVTVVVHWFEELKAKLK